jgi:hypothetical protein
MEDESMATTRSRKSALAALAAAALFLAALPAAAAEAEANGAKTLLAKASSAIGEDNAWTSRVETGIHIAWDTPGWGTLKADYTRAVKKPDKLKIDQDNSAYDHPFYRMYYYNGGDAWYVVNLNIGRSPNVTANMKNLIERVDGIAYYLAACDTFFAVPEVPGDSLLSGAGLLRAGCVLRGDTVLWDIDAKTHLPARRIEPATDRVFILEDYRDSHGFLVPFHVTVYAGGRKAEEFLWSAIAFDEAIDDALFEENRPQAQ